MSEGLAQGPYVARVRFEPGTLWTQGAKLTPLFDAMQYGVWYLNPASCLDVSYVITFLLWYVDKDSFISIVFGPGKGKGSPIHGFECWARCLSPVLGHRPLGGIAVHRR